MTIKEEKDLIDLAVNGDQIALEQLLASVQDLIFNLSLRMLGMVSDAEDATQEIFVKIMTNLSSFRKESRFQTWVYRIAIHFLLDYKKSMFSRYPLTFDDYSKDIVEGGGNENNEYGGLEQNLLAEELKMSCTNVMLQCLDAESRCIFILGTMFHPDSKIAGEVLGITPENYRQKLSRARKKMSGFLAEYCGLGGSKACSCQKRVAHAVQQHRLDPEHLEYNALKWLDQDILSRKKENMEQLDQASLVFGQLPSYKAPVEAKAFLKQILESPTMEKVLEQ